MRDLQLHPVSLERMVRAVETIEVGLIDETRPSRFAPPLAERLQALLDTPDG